MGVQNDHKLQETVWKKIIKMSSVVKQWSDALKRTTISTEAPDTIDDNLDLSFSK